MKIPFLVHLSFLSLLSCGNSHPKENLQKQELVKDTIKYNVSRSDIQINQTYEEYINAGESFLQDRKPYDAIKQFEQAIRIDDKKVEGYYGLGVSKSMVCFNEQKLCDEAISELNRAIKINPEYRNPYFNLSVCKTQTGDFIGALNDLDKAIQQHPNDPDCYDNRGSINLILGDTINACRDFYMAQKTGSITAQQKIILYCK